MSYTLYTPESNFRAFKALIAAEYAGVDVAVSTDLSNLDKLSVTGKAPVLVTPAGNVFESNAIARHIARVGRGDAGLLGNSMSESSSIDSWMDFATAELEVPACIWWYPVAGYMPFNPSAYTKAKADLAKALKRLELGLGNNKYLVNDQITLADIVCVAALVYPFKMVCDEEFLKKLPNVTRWFTSCVSQEQFKAVIGNVVMSKKEILATNNKGSQ